MTRRAEPARTAGGTDYIQKRSPRESHPMNDVSHAPTSASRDLRRTAIRLAAVLLLVATSQAFAAGAPDIVWAGGGHTGVNAAAISPDGTVLATGSSYDATIKLWRASDGTLIRTLNATLGGVQGLAYSPD